MDPDLTAIGTVSIFLKFDDVCWWIYDSIISQIVHTFTYAWIGQDTQGSCVIFIC